MKLFAWEGKQPRSVLDFGAETSRRSAAPDEGPALLFEYSITLFFAQSWKSEIEVRRYT